MKKTKKKLRKIKVDALYGKKKHFNAADRKEKYHYWVGVPLIIINIVVGSILFYVLTDGTDGNVKYVPLVLALLAALLSGLQTFLNFQKKVEGHRRVGNKYLAIMKKCDRLEAYVADGIVENVRLVNEIEQVSDQIDQVNIEAESYPTNKNDYKLAQEGIESGEETYTEGELNI